jgi:hypothetical protein
MDDAIGETADRFFERVNQRLQLNQLQEGEVRESLNGRMEGYWKPRKNVVSRTGALTTGGSPLALPFLLVGTGDNTEYILIESGDTLVTEGGVVFATEQEVIISTSKVIASSSLASGVVTITITAGHEFIAGTIGYGLISGLTFTGTDPNGIRLLTYASATTMTFPVTAATTDVSGAGTLSQAPINDEAAANVRASCLFSDPNDSNKEYVIIALDTVAKKIDLDDYSITDIPYPAGDAIGADTDMIQVFDKVMIFREGQQALEWYPNGRPIISASSNGDASPNTIVTVNLREHGLVVGTSITVAGLTTGTPPSGTYTVATVTGQDTFTFLAASISTSTTFGVAVATVTDGFTLSPGGAYTQPQVFDSHGGRVSVDGGLVTITVDGNTTLNAGNIIIVYENTIPELSSLVGKEFQVVSATTTQIQFYAPVPNIILRDITAATQASSIVKLFTDTNHGIPVGDIINVNAVTYTTGTNPNGLFTTIRQATNIISATISGSTVTINCTGHGFSTGNSITIDGIEFTSGTNPNGVFIITNINANSFSYTLVGGVGTYITTSAFATIDDINKRLLYNLVGASGSYTVASAYVTTATGASNQQIGIGGRFSAGGGFMHQPGAPWGIHFQRRLWVPFYYDQSGAYNVPAYTSRKITDEISVSDILDTTTFDQIENQFRVSGGTADFVVAMHGFYDDGLVVLNRNSLHLVKGTLGGLLDVTVKELTSEIGCLARKSVVMRGNAMLFLSDDGVYGIEFLNDYNLRGTEEPLSKNIQPYIDRINADYSDRAVGILFENRYYLAVPLDSVPGAGDSYGNNAILVYNFLNKGWESLDTFGDSRFLIKDFVIGSASERNNIYAVTSNGGLHQIEASESSNDTLNVDNSAAVVSTTINSTLITRGYDLATMERKRFTDVQINMQNLAGSNGEYDISFTTEDPDTYEQIIDPATGLRKSVLKIGTTTNFLGGTILGPSPDSPNEAESASIRCRLGGIRGFTGTMILTRTVGSPKINSIKVAGSVTNRQIISQR